MRNRIIALGLLSVLTGCQVSPIHVEDEPSKQGVPDPGSEIRSFNHVRNVSVYLRKVDGRWVASEDGDLNDSAVEQILVRTGTWSYDLGLSGVDRSKTDLCVTKYLDRREHGYFYCNSNFYSVEAGRTVAGGVIRGVISLGILTVADAFTGGTGYSVEFDKKGLDVAVAEADAIALAKRIAVRSEYLAAFRAIKTSTEGSSFVDRFSGKYDPEGLVAQAIARTESLRIAEEEQRRAQAEDDRVRRAQEAANEEERRRVAEELRKKEEAARMEAEKIASAWMAELRKRTLHFRSVLKVGDDSHCGLVVEVKPPIARIQTMIGEQWLKIEQLHRAGDAPCRFVNGVYRD